MPTTTNLKDLKEATIDALLIRAGARKLSTPGVHPHAAALLERREPLLKNLAIAFGRTTPRMMQGGLPDAAAFGAGLSTSDFKNALAAIAKITAVRVLSGAVDHRKICRPLFVPNFRDTHFPSLDIDFDLEEIVEDGEVKGVVDIDEQDGLTARVGSFGKTLRLGRELIANDSVSMIGGAFAQVGGAVARLEARRVAGLLEANPTLGDEQPMFDGALGNIEASALDKASLGRAMGKLMNMATPTGGAANLSAACLYVAADIELAAREIVHQANLALVVVPSAFLASGRWYLLASPDLAPVVGMVRLEANPEGLLIAPARHAAAFDGVALGVRAEFAIVALGRVGAVRGGV